MQKKCMLIKCAFCLNSPNGFCIKRSNYTHTHTHKSSAASAAPFISPKRMKKLIKYLLL